MNISLVEECAIAFRGRWEVLSGVEHTPWSSLSQREQDEVRASVSDATWIVYGLLDSGAYSMEVAATLVHESWKRRNWWGDARLMVPYSQLPEAEKEKDRELVRAVTVFFRDYLPGVLR